MGMIQRFAGGSAVLAILALAAAGCGGKGGASVTYQDPHPLPQDTMQVATPRIGTYGGRFVIAETSSPKTFNAMMANETSSTDVTDRMFISLTDINYETQQDYGVLAKSWDVSDDGLTWTYHLRHGAAFSDGHPISADDVLFSFEVAYDPVLHPSVQDLLMPGGKKFEITAPDSYTVVMKIASRYALMNSAVGSVRIMPKHVLEAAYRKGEFASAYNTSTPPAQVVTSGAWMLEENAPGEKTVLTRNPYWFGVDPEGHRLPYLNELVYLIVPDQNTADLKFRSGEVDALDNVKPENYQWYEDNQKKGNYTLYDLGPSLNTNFFWFNLNRLTKAKEGRKVGNPAVGAVKYAWFNNPVFRRAVSMAVDRDAMIKSIFFGDAVKNWSTSTPANKIWHSSDIVHYDYNPEEAKKLIASMGWKDLDGDGIVEDEKGNTVSFTMATNSDNVIRLQMMNFIRDDLAKVGIKMTPAPSDFNTLVTNIREDFDYESILLGLSSAVPPDPGMGQNVWRSSGNTHYWHVRQTKPATPAEAQLNLLMDELIGTNDLGERKRYWTDMENIINDQSWFEWLPTLVLKVPVRNRFGNMRPNVMPNRILWCIDQVYLKRPGSPA